MSEEILGMSAQGVLNDHRLHHRLIRALEMGSGRSYMDSFGLLQRGMREAGAGATVYTALEHVGVVPEDLAADLVTLEHADRAKAQIAQKAARMLDSVGVSDPRAQTSAGTVAQGDSRHMGVAISDEDYASIRDAHPRPVWSRLRRAERLPGGGLFVGPEGEKTFADADKLHALAGTDYVASREVAGGRAVVEQEARRHQGQLDAAVAKGSSPSERRLALQHALRAANKQLDAALGEANRQLDAALGDAERSAAEGMTRHGPLHQVRLDDGGDDDGTDRLIALSRRMRGAE